MLFVQNPEPLKKLVSELLGIRLESISQFEITNPELTVIKAMEVPEMEQAINAYRKITATAEFRELERMRSYARHNEASACRPLVLLKQARL
jgi:hypothetical protein